MLHQPYTGQKQNTQNNQDQLATNSAIKQITCINQQITAKILSLPVFGIEKEKKKNPLL